MAEINPITATIWGNGAAFEEATARQAADLHRSLVKHIDAHGRRVEVTGRGITDALAYQGASIVAAIQSDGALTRELMEEGFGDLLAEASAQTELLRAILDAIENPRRTQADELIRDGIAAFESGVRRGGSFWFDDAETDFREALDTRRYTFMAHWFLGRIAFEVREDPDQAVEHFDMAARYSEDENPTTSAMALTWSSRILWGMGRFREAAERAKRAVSRATELADPHFHLALATVRIEGDGISELVIEQLATAIGIRPGLFYTAAAESALANDTAVREYLDRDYRSVIGAASDRADTLDRLIGDADETMKRLTLGPMRQLGALSEVRIRLDDVRQAQSLLRHALSNGRFDNLVEALAETELADGEAVNRASEELRRAESSGSHLRSTDGKLGTGRAMSTALARDVMFAVVGLVALSFGAYPLALILAIPADSWAQAFGWSSTIVGLLGLGGIVVLVLFGEVAMVRRGQAIRKERIAFERRWLKTDGA